MDVTVSESDCEFKFNFGKVYWNSRLSTEHRRLVERFKEGEAVCDIMAGVGPFAVPAGKRNVFVRANDLNPDSFQGLQYAIQRNKVGNFVTASCSDGRDFIQEASKALASSQRTASLRPRTYSSIGEGGGRRSSAIVSESSRALTEPPTFDHYVMNLPATAIEFLNAFRGTYVGREHDFANRKLPMVHVYCFAPRMETEEEEHNKVCEMVSMSLGHKITPNVSDVEIWYVRLVSPRKKMFCASFRLPPEIAFWDSSTS